MPSLECSHCGGRMRIISFIERCQADVIERILRHLGLWEGALGTLPIARGPPRAPPVAAQPPDVEIVPDPEYLEFEYARPRRKHRASCSWCSIRISFNPMLPSPSGRGAGGEGQPFVASTSCVICDCST